MTVLGVSTGVVRKVTTIPWFEREFMANTKAKRPELGAEADNLGESISDNFAFSDDDSRSSFSIFEGLVAADSIAHVDPLQVFKPVAPGGLNAGGIGRRVRGHHQNQAAADDPSPRNCYNEKEEDNETHEEHEQHDDFDEQEGHHEYEECEEHDEYEEHDEHGECAEYEEEIGWAQSVPFAQLSWPPDGHLRDSPHATRASTPQALPASPARAALACSQKQLYSRSYEPPPCPRADPEATATSITADAAAVGCAEIRKTRFWI